MKFLQGKFDLGTVPFEKLFGFVKGEAEKLADFAAGKFARPVAFERHHFESAPIAVLPVEVQLPGNRVGHIH
ncbi:MAG: hypothetical protein ABIP85_20895 [Chthoniobacteraceae bacterium]